MIVLFPLPHGLCNPPAPLGGESGAPPIAAFPVEDGAAGAASLAASELDNGFGELEFDVALELLDAAPEVLEEAPLDILPPEFPPDEPPSCTFRYGKFCAFNSSTA